jgi:hypothetical protein
VGIGEACFLCELIGFFRVSEEPMSLGFPKTCCLFKNVREKKGK